ncbi:phage portal protein, HK97 family [Filomicrobium insigne]|uniref:Phage portal protein, HK97 family n=1 Tax=Filomicrobium insigne TaxID=418854 RepID=A0A1H0SEY7_9HYPH|nr:phage portal protein [Filomicrobium insigne]SDP40333.1 phage portal protein, HK97 family [Filomicrobium insigne]
MGLLTWATSRMGLTDSAKWSAFFGRESHAGTTVTAQKALQLAAVWACVKATAQAVSSLPLKIYEKTTDGDRKLVTDHDLVNVLEYSPNEDQTPLEFWEAMVSWLLVSGNAYAEKVKTGNRLSALRLLPSDKVSLERDADNVLRYRYSDGSHSELLSRDSVFHLKGFGFGGDLGLSAISYGVQTFGTAIATEETAAKTFANGLQASGVLSSDQILKEPQRNQLQKIMEEFVGSRNAGKLMVLEAGLKYQALSLNPEDAQMLESRRFDIEQICRWFGVPPIVIGHAAAGVTTWGSGIEHILLAWLTLGIDPLCDRIEQRIRKQLFNETERKRFYAEFNREALLQMDSTAKSTFLSQMVNNGLMTRNEGRAKLNLPRKDGGDALTIQTALAPLSDTGTPLPKPNGAILQ